jgi:hypothetical protein
MKTFNPAIQAFTTWTCDRCGHQEIVDEGFRTEPRNSHPDKWNFLILELHAPVKHLCWHCSIHAVMLPEPIAPLPPDPPEAMPEQIDLNKIMDNPFKDHPF